MKYFLSHDNRLLKQAQGAYLFAASEVEQHLCNHRHEEILLVDESLYVIRLNSKPEGYEALDLRAAMEELDAEGYRQTSRAQQLINWRTRNRYCGACGQPNLLDQSDLALVCSACANRNYPRISPCIIVLVEDGDRILLAHNVRFTENRFSTLAGFVEAGESVERAVAREIFEEVGVEVDRLRYFSSQAWPFPDSLMLAFFAEYQGGEIRPDGIEISAARWFRLGDLDAVTLPPPFAISRQLIDDWVARQTETPG